MKTQAQNAFNRRRSRIDWLARQLMTGSGWLVLAMFLLLIGHIFFNVFPLFKSPTLQLDYSVELPANAHDGQLVDLISGPAVLMKQGCDLALYEMPSASTSSVKQIKRFPFKCDASFNVHNVGHNIFVTRLKAGTILEVLHLKQHGTNLQLVLLTSLQLPSRLFQNVSNLSFEFAFAAKQITILASDFENDNRTYKKAYWFSIDTPTEVFEQTIPSAQHVVALTQIGQLMIINDTSVSFVDKSNQQISLTLLDVPLDKVVLSPTQRSIFAFDASYRLHKWILRNVSGQFVFERNEQINFRAHQHTSKLIFDAQSNGALQFFDNGDYSFLNSVTGQGFSWRRSMLPTVDNAQWSNNKVFVFENTQLHQYKVSDIQGIETLQSLFSENWYEGYDTPSLTWQTSSADDHYEAKYSLVPMLIGSLKASLLALIVAIPLALGAAMYTSYFATSTVRTYLKPSIEMLEAVPSVIIGFIAAVWLAPLAEQFLISIIIFIVLLPLFLLASAALQPILSEHLNERFSRNWEVFFIILSTFFLALFCFGLGEVWQTYLVSMNATSVIQSLFSISKTTLVVAVALGVAIAPSIYSLADDALSEVPKGLIKASFALGATRLQTLKRVVIAVAMPSLISAVMLGFGRAFGETMILLMVTGNTPVSDWSIFEGLRSMTANLAIELQEADTGSAHFNVLFATAAILFLFTFVLNTGAELLRRRLRKVVGNVND